MTWASYGSHFDRGWRRELAFRPRRDDGWIKACDHGVGRYAAAFVIHCGV